MNPELRDILLEYWRGRFDYYATRMSSDPATSWMELSMFIAINRRILELDPRLREYGIKFQN